MEKDINIEGLNNNIDSYRGNKKPKRSFRQWWREGHHKFYALAVCLAVLLLAWLIWHRQISDMWASLFDNKPAVATEAAVVNSESGVGTTGTTSAAGQKNSTATTQETAKSTTTTTTTTTTNSSPDNPSDGNTPSSTDLLTLATNIKPGQTLDQLTALAGGTGPSTCTDIGLANLVQASVCTWTADGKSVVVTLQNGVVSGLPVKLGF